MAAKGPKDGARKREQGSIVLAPEVERSLAAYACAAAAAGVSVAAMAAPADAKIIYTPTHTTIGLHQSVPLDLNHDGHADFSVAYALYASAGPLYLRCASLRSSGCALPSNQVWGQGGASVRFASALPAGFKVRANKAYFQQGRGNRNSASLAGVSFGRYGSTSQSGGQWLSTKNRYLGLRFVINGQLHYGWARLTVGWALGQGINAVLTGYAYETIPNKTIITGKTKGPDVITLPPATLEPVTLGHLAGGASQIPAWRREKRPAPPPR
jgi:hypothetical protein